MIRFIGKKILKTIYVLMCEQKYILSQMMTTSKNTLRYHRLNIAYHVANVKLELLIALMPNPNKVM